MAVYAALLSSLIGDTLYQISNGDLGTLVSVPSSR
jgi:hypothetical protein